MNYSRAWIDRGRAQALQLTEAIRSRLALLKKPLPLGLEVLILLLAVATALLWLDLKFRPRIAQVSLPAAGIAPEKGYAYLIKIANPGLRYLSAINPASVDLYEDGTRLGPSRARKEDIRNFGRGAFSYRQRGLYFSTSDGSSPRTNGRAYWVKSRLSPTPFARWLALFALFIMFWRAAIYRPLALQRAILARGGRTFEWLVTPVQFGATWVVPALTALALVAACWTYLITLWGSAHTVDLAIGGFFQISDASGYAACANQMLDEGVGANRVATYFGGWCLRRPTYPVFLAALLGITGRNWLGLFLLQSVFVALSLTVLLRAVCRFAGPLAAFCVLGFTFAFAAGHAFPLTLSENLGLALGAVGLALLLDAVRLTDNRLLFFAAASLSLALNARAGAFFVLPMLLAGIFFQSRSWRSRWITSAIVFAGMATGFALHFSLVAHFGGSLNASHSNFAHTVYGLSIGGKGWSQVYTDHAEIFKAYPEAEAGRLIYQLAIKNIIDSPQLLLHALTKNLFQYLKIGPFSMVGLRLLWWVGAWAIVLRWRDLPYRIIGLISVGTLLSAPFIVQDGGLRLFAATWAVTGLQVGLGLKFLLSLFLKLVDQSRSTEGFGHTRPQPFDLAIPVILLVTILLPLTPLRGLAASKPVPAQGCKVGEKELIARLGHGSYMIVLVAAGGPTNFWHLQVPAEALRKQIGEGWFDKDFAALPVPTTLINGYQTMAGNIGEDIRVASHGDLGEYYGKTVSMCYRTDASDSVAGNAYYRVVSVRPIAR